MALAESWMNRTVVDRLAEQDRREAAFVGLLDDAGLNRAQRRALRKAHIVPPRSSRKAQRKRARKDGTIDVLEARVRFFGEEYVLGSEDRRGILKLPKDRQRFLSKDETERYVRVMKKRAKRK